MNYSERTQSVHGSDQSIQKSENSSHTPLSEVPARPKRNILSVLAWTYFSSLLIIILIDFLYYTFTPKNFNLKLAFDTDILFLIQTAFPYIAYFNIILLYANPFIILFSYRKAGYFLETLSRILGFGDTITQVIRDSVEFILQLWISCLILLFLKNNRYVILSMALFGMLGFFRLVLIESFTTKKILLLAIILYACFSSLIDGATNTEARPLLYYFNDNKISPEEYLNFLIEYGFDIEQVQVNSSNENGAASLPIGKFSQIFFGSRFFKPKYLNIFKAIALHELGHCRYTQTFIIWAQKILTEIPLTVFMVRFFRTKGPITFNRFVNFIIALFFISKLLELVLNSFYQLLEYDADRFSYTIRPDLSDHLMVGLLLDKIDISLDNKTIPNNFVIQARLHNYFPFNPFYEHPSRLARFERIKQANL